MCVCVCVADLVILCVPKSNLQAGFGKKSNVVAGFLARCAFSRERVRALRRNRTHLPKQTLLGIGLRLQTDCDASMDS